LSDSPSSIFPRSVEFFASAPAGTEPVLEQELAELGFRALKSARGGVKFSGPIDEGWRACLHSRIAQRIQTPLSRFPAGDAQALYDGVRSIDWSPFVSPSHSLAISAVCRDSALTHSEFICQKTKDAIVDQVRDATGQRPDVDRDDPDLRVFVYLWRDRATVYVDLSGAPLHRRGYRTEAGEAPLRETLAAALLRFSGWDRQAPFVDPMCGSGTIAIEAALWSANIAPGIMRERFGFERWPCHDEEGRELMRGLRGQARANARGQRPRVAASDVDPGILDVARANASRAGVRLRFRECDVRNLQTPGGAVLVTNPPYQQRLTTEQGFERELAATIARQHGTRFCLLTPSEAQAKAIPLRPAASWPLFNGNIRCRLLVYDVP